MGRARQIALIVAMALVGLALLWRYANETQGPFQHKVSSELEIGRAGSEHSHLSLLMVVNSVPVDFSDTRYQLKSDFVHFEDDDGVYLHKHATGVTLPYFFETVGIKLTIDCLTIANREYCVDGESSLRTYLNREMFNDWDRYEFQNGDKILIDYGTTTPFSIQLELNSIPDLSNDLLRYN